MSLHGNGHGSGLLLRGRITTMLLAVVVIVGLTVLYRWANRPLYRIDFPFSKPTPSWNQVLPALSNRELAHLRRDCRGEGLVRLLNTPSLVNWSAVRAMEAAHSLVEERAHFGHFVAGLVPWLLAAPEHPLVAVSQLDQLEATLDCHNPSFASVLSGKRLSPPRFIVDVVPFAYNLDMLELRLLETYEAVDAFIVYEAPFTHQGVDKPLFFNISRHRSPGRWARFLDKLVHVVATRADVAAQLAEMQADPKSWVLDLSVRSEPLKRAKDLARLDPGSQRVMARVLEHASDNRALVIHSDDDEIVHGRVLYHLRMCELKPEARVPLYAPCVYYKSNLQWLLHAYDFEDRDPGCLQEAAGPGHSSEALQELKHYLWAKRPMLLSLHTSLAQDMLATDFWLQCHDVLPLPSAMHLSDLVDPAIWWTKKVAVIEGRLSGSLVPVVTDELLRAGEASQVTPLLVARTALQPACHWKLRVNHISTLLPEAQDLAAEAIPWALQANHRHFCWLAPDGDDFAADSRRPDFQERCPELTLQQWVRAHTASRSKLPEK